LGAYRLNPARRDLVRLAWILFGLFWCEAIVGGISVQVKLAWVSVMGHFLLALALVSIALRMCQRAREIEAPRAPVVAPGVRRLVRAVYVWTVGVVILGTLVTAAGPHGGDQEAKRLGIPITDLARVHGVAVDALIALTLLTTFVLVRTRAPRVVINAASLTITAMVAQGLLGYIQYARAIPAVLVGFHVFGAVLVFASVQQLQLATTAPLGECSEVGIGGHYPDELGSYRETIAPGPIRDS
jgi:cytochrome c oxidase assembly protein subunit 15